MLAGWRLRGRGWSGPVPTFPTVVDAENRLALAYDFRAVPNGIVLDADQVVRFRKLGGFSCERDDDRAAVNRLLRGEALPASAERPWLSLPTRPRPCGAS